MPVIETHKKHCHKRGYKSRGAAEAHLRGLEKAKDYKPDLKDGLPMVVYYCIAISCRENPWHVGHNQFAKA
jgi:hypothetical protein